MWRSLPPPARMTDTADHWLTHSSGTIFARTWTGSATGGQAAPIVLFHDSLGCVALWRDFPARLAAATGRTVIAYDRLGFGQSTARSGRLPPSFVADEAEQVFPLVRGALGIDRFVAFGHSVGGGMAAWCAARFPDACDALITESAQGFVEERTVAGIRAAKAQFADPVHFGRLEKYHGVKARWVLDAWTGTWLAPAFASWTLAPALERLRAPALVIHGTLDEYGSARQPEWIAATCAAGARLEMVAGAHHVPHRERPGTVLDLVSHFLRD